ncbi:MAG TPA: hypothetical protein VNW98_06475 [Burkholderiaceae bacterium]|nr:hypothetical protein [Burkholderiaceae bacterium]
MAGGRVTWLGLFAVGAVVASGPLAAADLLGLYVGAAVGHSTVRADPDLLSIGATWSF